MAGHIRCDLEGGHVELRRSLGIDAMAVDQMALNRFRETGGKEEVLEVECTCCSAAS